MSSDETHFPLTNRQFLLRVHPIGMANESDFVLAQSTLQPLAHGQVAARTVFLSVDPYVRRAIGGDTSYPESVPIGGLIPGLAIGKVIASRNPAFADGEHVLGNWGWQEYSISDGTAWLKIDSNNTDVSAKLGVLGMPGLTAYFGVLDVCGPKSGQTLVVSGAAGAVGSLAGQIAKIAGATVIGIAGSDQKTDWLVSEAGFDGALNYKSPDFAATLKRLCPHGIDCYFDNVGGAISDAAMALMNSFGRVAVCGLISQYNDCPQEHRFAMPIFDQILRKQLRLEGFNFAQFQNRWREALVQLAEWIAQGSLRPRETIVDGFLNTPRAFVGLMRGDNIGRMLVRVIDPVSQ